MNNLKDCGSYRLLPSVLGWRSSAAQTKGPARRPRWTQVSRAPAWVPAKSSLITQARQGDAKDVRLEGNQQSHEE